MIKKYKLIKVEMTQDNAISESILKETYSKREIRSFMKAVQKLNPEWEMYITVKSSCSGLVEGGII